MVYGRPLTSEAPTIQNNTSVDPRHDITADSAAAISNPEINIRREFHLEEACHTGIIPQNNPNNVTPNNNNHNNIQHPSSFSNSTPQVCTDSTSSNRSSQNRPVLGSEGLPPPHYDTINHFEQRNPSVPSYPHIDLNSPNLRDNTPTPRSQATRGRDQLSRGTLSQKSSYLRK